MSLNNFNPPAGATFKKRRVARGIGSGMGKQATRGGKGQSARRQIHPNFEGGQSPIQRRLPVKKGFKNINHKEYAIVNLDDLSNLFEDGAEVTPESLVKSGIISASKDGVKVLAPKTKSKTFTAAEVRRAIAKALEDASGPGGKQPLRESDALRVQKRDDGRFEVRRPGAKRASAVTDTQTEAIARARELEPGKAPIAKRGRQKTGVKRGTWRGT